MAIGPFPVLSAYWCRSAIVPVLTGIMSDATAALANVKPAQLNIMIRNPETKA
jgi:hypothetical protein